MLMYANTGSKGDLSTAKGPNGEAPKWSIPKGVVTYQLANGHAPGQVRHHHLQLRCIYVSQE